MPFGDEVWGADGEPVRFVLDFTVRPVTEADDSNSQVHVRFDLVNEAEVLETLHEAIITRSQDDGEIYTVELVADPLDYGWYGIRMHVSTDDCSYSEESLVAAFVVVRPPAPGLRPDSLFGLNTGGERDVLFLDANREAARRMGAKWRRGIPFTDPWIVTPERGVFWGEREIAKALEQIDLWQESGISLLGYVNYNARWNVAKSPTGAELPPYRARPADLAVHADMVRHLIEPFHDRILNWELWNEPVPFGYYWSGSAQDYRDMTREVWDQVKPRFPEVNLIGGGYTCTTRDMVYAVGSRNAGYVDGTASHPYGKPGLFTPTSAAWEAQMNLRESKTNGRAGIWMTEIGTGAWEYGEAPVAERDELVAKSVAPIYLLHALGAGDTPLHAFWFISSYAEKTEIDDGFNMWDQQKPKPVVAAYAAMTSFLEDTVSYEDLYSFSRNIWAVNCQRKDGENVTVIWADRGTETNYRQRGTISFPDMGFECFDYMGREVESPKTGEWILPLDPMTVYYLKTRRSKDEVKAALSQATFSEIPPVRITLLSLDDIPRDGGVLRARVESESPLPVDGTLEMNPNGDFRLATNQKTFSLKPGESTVLEFPVTKRFDTPANRYLVRYQASIRDRVIKGAQVIQVAAMPHFTPNIDGDLSDWNRVIPVSITAPGSLTDWGNARPPMLNDGGYLFRAAWDEDFFYFAAEIPDTTPSFIEGDNGGILKSDCLQLAFSCIKENPDNWVLQHPLYEKSLRSEVDYEFGVSLQKTEQGDAAVNERLTAPGTHYQQYYPSNAPTTPALGPLESGRISGYYDDQAKSYVYEGAIPWSEMPEMQEIVQAALDGQMQRIRFSFRVSDFDRFVRQTSWQETAGNVVFGSYGFSRRMGSPRWRNDYPLAMTTEWSLLPAHSTR
jgi:hypothetical protein